MRHELIKEFNEERFADDDAKERVIAEFLYELFNELGFPSMRIRVYDNPIKQTKVFRARWEE